MPHSAYLMIVEAGAPSVVLVGRDGAATLPRIDDWDGDPASLGRLLGVSEPDSAASASAASAGVGAADAPWRRHVPPLTILASLAEHPSDVDDEGGNGAQLFLCEPAHGETLEHVDLARWTDLDADLHDLPAPFTVAMRTAFHVAVGAGDGTEAGIRWPRFCLPGFSSVLANVVASDAVAATCVGTPGMGVSDRATDLDQLQGWCLSSVWSNQEVVLKFAHPAFASEPTINRFLHQWAPELVTEVVASGVVTGGSHEPTPWMLQRRAQGTSTEPTDTDPEAPRSPAQVTRLRTVAALARLQLSLRDEGEALLAAGVVDRSVDVVLRALPALWAYPELSELLEPSEQEALPALDAHLQDRLGALHAVTAAPVLTHGDLHLGNVITADDGSVRFIDWTDAVMTWPGIDLRALLPRPSEVEAREEVFAAYEQALGPELAPAVRPGADLAPLYYALNYARIDAFLPPSARWHFRGTTTRMVRLLLKTVPA